MESWQMFYLGGAVMVTGSAVGPSNGGTLILFIWGLFQFGLAVALRLFA